MTNRQREEKTSHGGCSSESIQIVEIIQLVQSSFDKKETQHFEANLISYTALCLLKSNRKKYLISSEKQATLSFWAFSILFIQLILILIMSQDSLCGLYSFFALESLKFDFCVNDVINPKPHTTTFRLFAVKILVNLMLHLDLVRHFIQGLSLMKYVCNHPDKFDQPEIVFIFGIL